MKWWPFGRKATAMDSGDLAKLLGSVFGGGATKSGASVNVMTSLEVTAVLACVRVIANGVAQVPLKLMRESADGRTRLPAKDHPLYPLLHRRPNDWMTSFQLRQTIMLHVLLCGDAFVFINRAGRDRNIVELIPFAPGDVTIKRADDMTLSYVVKAPNGSQQEFPAEAIWHLRGPSWNGYSGLPVVKIAREAIGLSMATEEAHARLHQNGARVSGLYSVEGTIGEDQYKKLKAWIEKEHMGSANTGRIMIMDRSAKFSPTAMNGVDAQHLETRAYQITEVCRAFGVMPIMVGYSDKAATYASAEQMFLAHVVHCLSPWYVCIEQSIDTQLLSDGDRDAGLYAKLIDQGLLRGALKDTSDYLTRLVTNGVMTRNEARDKLDLNPLDGLDEPLTPANMTVGAQPDPIEEPATVGA